MCATKWPTTGHYVECPRCEAKTSWVNEDEPLTQAEADAEVGRIKFDAWYEQHGAKHPATPEQQAIVDRLVRGADEIMALEAIPVEGEEIAVDKLPPEHFGRDAHILRRYG